MNMTNNEQQPVRAILTLYDQDVIIKQVVYEYKDGSISDELPRRIHEGMFTDSILFGEELELRFFLYFNAIHLYKCRVEELKFISEREEYCHIQCFGEHVALMPGQEIVLKKKKQVDEFEPQ